MKKTACLSIAMFIALTSFSQFQPQEDQRLSTTDSPTFAAITAKGYSTGNKLRVYQSATDLWDLGTGSNKLTFSGYNGTWNTAMQLTREGVLFVAGSLGVGTTAPAYKLDVNGEIRANRMHFSYSTPLDWGNVAGQSRFRWTHEDTDQINLKLQYSKNSGSTWANGLTLNSSGIVRVGDYEVWHAGNLTPAKRASLLSADMNTYSEPGLYEYDGAGGNVTNAPAGSANYRVLSMGSNLRHTQMAFQWDANRTFFRRKTDQGFFAWNEFWHSGNFNPASYLPLEGGNITGQLNIGTTASQKDLNVNGNIKTRKITVTVTGWADYVFDSSYQLTPLHQVEKFIRENKHLANVPSAETVEKEGLELGDHQAVLLRKIEELTLYIINQNKDMELLKKKVEMLEAKVK